jgi:hypothetical protein
LTSFATKVSKNILRALEKVLVGQNMPAGTWLGTTALDHGFMGSQYVGSEEASSGKQKVYF